MGRLELDFGGIDCKFGGISPLFSTSEVFHVHVNAQASLGNVSVI